MAVLPGYSATNVESLSVNVQTTEPATRKADELKKFGRDGPIRKVEWRPGFTMSTDHEIEPESAEQPEAEPQPGPSESVAEMEVRGKVPESGSLCKMCKRNIPKAAKPNGGRYLNCTECLHKQLIINSKRRDKQRLASKCCCGKDLQDGYKSCKECRQRRVATRLQRKARRECSNCGKTLGNSEQHVLCVVCRRKAAAGRHAREEENKCRDCNMEIAETQRGSARCESCRTSTQRLNGSAAPRREQQWLLLVSKPSSPGCALITHFRFEYSLEVAQEAVFDHS